MKTNYVVFLIFSKPVSEYFSFRFSLSLYSFYTLSCMHIQYDCSICSCYREKAKIRLCLLPNPIQYKLNEILFKLKKTRIVSLLNKLINLGKC